MVVRMLKRLVKIVCAAFDCWPFHRRTGKGIAMTMHLDGSITRDEGDSQ
jgi:hypothetical protein